MRIPTFLGAVAALTLALPAVALAEGPSVAGARAATAPVVGVSASTSARTKAYGTYCKGVSTKRVKGSKGTPFAACTTAMARLATKRTASPRAACRGLATKRAAGVRRAPFAVCVHGGTKLLKDALVAEEAAADAQAAADDAAAEAEDAEADGASEDDVDAGDDQSVLDDDSSVVEDDGVADDAL